MNRVHKNIEEATTLSGNFYSCSSTFKNVLERIFVGSWQLTADDSKLKKLNSTFPFNFMEESIQEPLFLINNKKGIKCFSNVCTHRGNILVDKNTAVKNHITCKYHGKQFNTCGKFLFMPESDGMKDFPTKKDDLTEIPVFQWRQFIFSSLSPIFDFNQVVNNIESKVGWMPIESFVFREDLSKEYSIDANWALYCDNYLEGFHIPFVHEDLSNTLDYNSYETEIFEFCNLQIGIGKDKSECFNLPETSSDYGKKIAAYYFWVFPNMMFNFYPWGLSINIISPISPVKTKITFKTYVWNEKMLNTGAGADVNKVELEDEEIVERVQKGVGSRFYKQGRFSPRMEKGVHHFHLLISQFLASK